MSEKVDRLGIQRDSDMMYYIKQGAVWASPRKQPGKPKGKAVKIEPIGVDLDYSKYLYFIDSDGDVARKARASGGGGRKKSKAAKAPAPSTGRSGKTVEQLERDIAECLAGKKTGNGNGNGNGTKKNGNGKPTKPTKKKKGR